MTSIVLQFWHHTNVKTTCIHNV